MYYLIGLSDDYCDILNEEEMRIAVDNSDKFDGFLGFSVIKMTPTWLDAVEYALHKNYKLIDKTQTDSSQAV